jgi:Rod binding domain-containing protein
MKIPVSQLASKLASGAVNQPRDKAPLKPLVASDFAGKLDEAMSASGIPTQATQPGGIHSNLHPLTSLDMIPGLKNPSAPLKPLDLREGGLPSPADLAPLGETQYQHAGSRRPQTEHEKIEATARKWVSQTFYGTMLKQMRESPFKSEIFSGGRGGQAFSSLLDQHLADHMTRGTGNKLVNLIARKLEARSGYQKQTTSLPSGNATPPTNTMRMPHVTTSLRA